MCNSLAANQSVAKDNAVKGKKTPQKEENKVNKTTTFLKIEESRKNRCHRICF